MENGKKVPLKKRKKSLDYEKIEGLIRRGDCRTAETLIKKRPLSPLERDALSALKEAVNAMACLDAAAFLVLRVLIPCLAPPSRRDGHLKRDLLWGLLAALGMAAVFSSSRPG